MPFGQPGSNGQLAHGSAVRSHEIYSIQYLRALAAISVHAFHVSEHFGGDFSLGASGVDIFFVISGFIMWVTTVDRPADPSGFALRRIARIVPLYWLVTIVTAAAIYLKPAFFYGAILTPANFLGSLLFMPTIRDGSFHPIVLQGWTLSYELLFYGVFGLALFARQSLRPIIVTSILCILVIANRLMPQGYFSVFTASVILEFAGGVLVGLAWTKGKLVPIYVGYLVLLLGLTLLFALSDFSSIRLIKWGIPAMLIVLGIVMIEKHVAMSSLKFMKFMGDVSYSIYLWPACFGPFMTGLVLRLKLPLALQPLIILVGSIAIAALLGLLIEIPINQRLQRLLRSRRKMLVTEAGSV